MQTIGNAISFKGQNVYALIYNKLNTEMRQN